MATIISMSEHLVLMYLIIKIKNISFFIRITTNLQSRKAKPLPSQVRRVLKIYEGFKKISTADSSILPSDNNVDCQEMVVSAHMLTSTLHRILPIKVDLVLPLILLMSSDNCLQVWAKPYPLKLIFLVVNSQVLVFFP